MKVLWITNILLPDALKYLRRDKLVVGGWMDGLLEGIRNIRTLQIAVASVYAGDELIQFVEDNVVYFLIPSKKSTQYYNPKLNKYFEKIKGLFQPDLIHIHGTEHAHGLSMLAVAPELKYTISIQGLVSVYAKYFFADISVKDVLKNITLKDLLYGGVFSGKKNYQKRGLNEREYIKNIPNIIGRTSWDRTHTYFLNKASKYHFCNEVLRSEFYFSEKWNLNDINKHTVFLSQGSYPIKGAHVLFEAIVLLKDEFPDIHVYIGGHDIVKSDSLFDRLKISGYGKQIRGLLNNYGIKKYITFTGELIESEMIEKYKKSHVFVCPSSIENSPNSLGEAQFIGVPSIGSFVGGVPDMITHNHTGLLYRFEDAKALAYNIKRIFENDELANMLSENAQAIAAIRHNKKKITTDIITIYENINKKK